jgi:hypothetical protein
MELAIKQNTTDKTFSLDVLINSDKFKQWINPSNVVMIHDINHDSALDYASYIVVTKDEKDEDDRDDSVTYSIHRFFQMGTTIHVSADHLGKSAEYVFVALLEKNYSRGTY